MAYPDDALPVVVEIAPGTPPASDPTGAAWTDVTTSVRLNDSDQIVISGGRGDWGDRVDPGTIALTFNNPTGDFSEHHPAGQWYGLLGRDTPLRVRLRRAQDAFGRSVSSGWGTSDSGQAWTNASGPAADYSVSAGTGYHSHSAVNAIRRTVLATSLVDVDQVVDVTTPVLITGAALVTGVLARHDTVGNQYYWLRCEFNAGTTTVTAKISKLVSGVSTTLATLAPVPSLAYAAGTPLRVRASVAGDRLAIKIWPAAGTEPDGWTLTAVDDDLTGPGAAALQSWLVSGNTNTLPVAVAFDNYQLLVDLAGGYVPAWAPRSDLSGKIRTVPVVARGVLARLAPDQATPPTRSPLRRTLGASSPVAYWPVEDGTIAAQAGSALPGQPAMAAGGVVEFKAPEGFASVSGDITYGTRALADLAAGGRLSAAMPAAVTTATTTAWTVHVAAQVDPGALSGDITLLEWATPGGTYRRWRLVVTTAYRTQVLAYDSAHTAYLMLDVATATPAFTQYAVSAYQVGPNITADLYIGSDVPDDTVSSGVTLTGITGISANPTGVTSSVDMPVGHVAVWAASAPPIQLKPAADGYGVITGTAWVSHLAEAATDRLARLVAEDGLTLTMPAVTEAGIVRMGSQPAGKPADLYHECVDADGGILAERPYRLDYTPREQLYNRAPVLTLTATQLGAAPEPDGTGRGYRNRVEASRSGAGTGGSSAVAEADEIADGAIAYDQSAQVAVHKDSQLPDQAGWRLHLASTRGVRWPRLTLNLQAVPSLIDAWLCCRPGSRILVTDPPADVAGQDVDVLLEGYTLTLGHKTLEVEANCSPGQPWDVAEVDGEQRVAADGSTLAAGITAGATTLSLASTTANGVWTTVAADFPLDLAVGGERVTASGISGATSPQTVTLTARGVNGVSRSWPAGTEVDVWQPAIAPL